MAVRSAATHRLRRAARRGVRPTDARRPHPLPRRQRHRPRADRRRGAGRPARDAIAEAQRLRETVERPPITDNARLCEKCSLAPVCLPEEVRHDREPERDPVRLFPPDRDGTTLHVVAQGTAVGVSGDSHRRAARATARRRSTRSAGSTRSCLHGFTQISTQAIRKCVEHGIGVHWLSVSGYHTASLVPTAGQVQRRIRQYQALTDEATCLRLAKQLAAAKVEGQYRYLMRASRGDDEARGEIQALAQRHPAACSVQIPDAAQPRFASAGWKASAAVHYFAALRRLLGPQVPDELAVRRPLAAAAADRFNALLSYGYGLAAHGGDAGGAGVAGWNRPSASSTRPRIGRLSAGAGPDGTVPRHAVGHAAGRLAQPRAVGSRPPTSP